MKLINWSQTILIAIMATAVPVGFLTIIGILAPGWPWLAITWLGLLTAVEALSTTLWLRHRNQLGLNKSIYRAAELVVLAIITRLFAWSINGNWPQAGQWRTYLLEPGTLFDGYYITALLILVIIWNWTVALTHIFHHLEISPAETNYYSGTHTGSDRPMPLNRVTLVETFFQHWLWGGIFLIVCAAATTFDLPELSDVPNPFAIGRLGLRPEILVATLSYFLSGFWLLSQARLSVMRARWLTGRVVKQEPVEKNWRRSSFMTLLVIAGLAALLPIGSTSLASRIISTLFMSLIYLLNFIILLFGTLMVRLLSLFGRPQISEEISETALSQEPLVLEFGGETILPPDSPSLIAGSIFWLIVLGIAIVAFVFFLRERGYRLPTWRHAWQTVRSWWHQWWVGLAAQVAKWQAQTPILINNPEDKRPFRRPRRFFRLNALSPRDQIRYFYLSTVRRASERGAPRQHSETPLEYAADLRANWPEVADEVTDLTEAFLKVQYQPESVDVAAATAEATAVKPIWKRLRTAIKQKK